MELTIDDNMGSDALLEHSEKPAPPGNYRTSPNTCRNRKALYETFARSLHQLERTYRQGQQIISLSPFVQITHVVVLSVGCESADVASLLLKEG